MRGVPLEEDIALAFGQPIADVQDGMTFVAMQEGEHDVADDGAAVGLAFLHEHGVSAAVDVSGVDD